MDLYLRKIIHPQARDNYRVVLKDDGDAVGMFWSWGIDNAIPMRDVETQGTGRNRRDCMTQFKAAWDRFSADEARLTDFLREKRRRLR